MSRTKMAAIAAALLALLAIPTSALAGHDRPASKGGGTADLALSVTAPAQISEGDGFDVDYLIANSGPDPAGGAKLIIEFDSSKAAFIQGFGCSASGETLTCALGDRYGPISAGSEVPQRIQFRALTSGTNFVATATLSAQTKDPNLTNNSVSVSIPLVLEYGCEGTVGLPSSPVSLSGAGYSPYFYSCQRSFSLATARNVLLELKPKANFEGTLSAELRSPGVPVTQVSGTFVAGQLVSGTASKAATLPAGDWTLTVSARAINSTIQTPWQVCVTPQGPCTPVMQPRYVSVYVPLSQGGFGGLVTAVQ